MQWAILLFLVQLRILLTFALRRIFRCLLLIHWRFIHVHDQFLILILVGLGLVEKHHCALDGEPRGTRMTCERPSQDSNFSQL